MVTSPDGLAVPQETPKKRQQADMQHPAEAVPRTVPRPVRSVLQGGAEDKIEGSVSEKEATG